MISWDETNPSGDDLLSELGQVWHSFKSNLRAGVEPAFYFTASSVSTGQALVSSSTPGSCRVYYGTRSQVSDPARPGALMVVSDESRLIAFGSSGSAVIGGSRMILNLVSNTGTGTTYRASSSGTASLVTGANSIVYPTAFTTESVTPFSVTMTPSATTSAFNYAVYNVTASGFSVWVSDEGLTSQPGCGIHWRVSGQAVTP